MQAGDIIPEFTLIDPKGARVSVKSLLNGKTTVLYFYPKDHTGGCTLEACTFRDSYDAFVKVGAQVIGVSVDPPEMHATFASKYKLPFTLVTDPDGSAAAAMGVNTVLGFLKGRATFVLDKNGKIVHRFDSRINMTRHVAESLEVVKSLVQAAA